MRSSPNDRFLSILLVLSQWIKKVDADRKFCCLAFLIKSSVLDNSFRVTNNLVTNNLILC